MALASSSCVANTSIVKAFCNGKDTRADLYLPSPTCTLKRNARIRLLGKRPMAVTIRHAPNMRDKLWILTHFATAAGLIQRPASISKLASYVNLAGSTLSRAAHTNELSRKVSQQLSAPFGFEAEIFYRDLKTFSTLFLDANPPPDEQGEALIKNAASIPDQDPLVRFEVSAGGKLHLVATSSDENDYASIEAFRDELLELLQFLQQRYSQESNTPQAMLLGPLTLAYLAELIKEPREINFTLLYSRGARLIAAKRRAEQEVSSGEWPRLEPAEGEAIDTVCDLHGPLIMSSASGRKIVANAREYDATPHDRQREDRLIEEFGVALSEATELIEPSTGDAIVEITRPIPNDPQPARSGYLRMVFTASALVAIVGGLSWMMGSAGTAFTVLAMQGAGRFLWEAAKQTKDFKSFSSELAQKYDERRLTEFPKSAGFFAALERFAQRRFAMLSEISTLRPEFSWARSKLRIIKRAKIDNVLGNVLPASDGTPLVAGFADLSTRSVRFVLSYGGGSIQIEQGSLQFMFHVAENGVDSIWVHGIDENIVGDITPATATAEPIQIHWEGPISLNRGELFATANPDGDICLCRLVDVEHPKTFGDDLSIVLRFRPYYQKESEATPFP